METMKRWVYYPWLLKTLVVIVPAVVTVVLAQLLPKGRRS